MIGSRISWIRLSDGNLAGLSSGAVAPQVAPEPAVPIRLSVKKDYIVCLDDGKKLKMLKRHLMTHYGMTPDDYRATLLLAKNLDLPMLCANPDIIVHWGDKLLYCAGALAKMYEEMGGTALYFGKPHPPIYDLARRRLLF